MSRALLYPIPDWLALCEARTSLSNLVVDFGSPLFLKDCVAVNSQDVVDAAHSHTLSEKGKFRLRVLAELDAFVHFSNDVCLAQEVVRDVLSRSDSGSEKYFQR